MSISCGIGRAETVYAKSALYRPFSTFRLFLPDYYLFYFKPHKPYKYVRDHMSKHLFWIDHIEYCFDVEEHLVTFQWYFINICKRALYDPITVHSNFMVRYLRNKLGTPLFFPCFLRV